MRTAGAATPAARPSSAMSASRVAALQPDDVLAPPRPVHQEPVDLALAHARSSRSLADVDDGSARADLVEELVGNQPVVQDHLGLAKATQSLERDQLGIARTGADERDEPAAHGSSSSFFRSPRGKKRIRRSSTSGSSSQGTSANTFSPARGSSPPRPPTKT